MAPAASPAIRWPSVRAPAPAPERRLRRVALLGNHLSRQCGIATFTTDLGAAIAAQFPALECFVVAMNDSVRRHARHAAGTVIEPVLTEVLR